MDVSYGGIFERGSREYTLDDFYSLQLDKLDKFICLKESGVVIPRDGDIESSSSEDEDSGDEDEEEDSGEDGEQEFDIENETYLSSKSDKQNRQLKGAEIADEPKQNEASAEDEVEADVDEVCLQFISRTQFSTSI